MGVAIDTSFALALFEVVFLGRPGAGKDELYRSVPLQDLFVVSGDRAAEVAAAKAKAERKSQKEVALRSSQQIWEVELRPEKWKRFEDAAMKAVAKAKARGWKQAKFFSRGFWYVLDFDEAVQINTYT